MSSLNHGVQKTILITGGSSGIGYQAVIKMLINGHKIILPCRNKKISERTLQRLSKENLIDSKNFLNASAPIMDLSDLVSIENFCSSVLNNCKAIDVLILNAGLQYTGAKNPRFSAQGYELTFATNHLSHHYLTYLLLPLLYKAKSPRIIITASEVHDPKSPGGRVGKLAKLNGLKGIPSSNNFMMLDGSPDFSADKAYKDSKLCNILFAKELAQKLSINDLLIPVISWAPGLVIPKDKEGFFRYSRKYNEIGQVAFAFIARDLFRIAVDPSIAGDILYNLSDKDIYNVKGFKYYSYSNQGFNKHQLLEKCTSQESQDLSLSSKLWEYTCDLLGVDTELPI